MRSDVTRILHVKLACVLCTCAALALPAAPALAAGSTTGGTAAPDDPSSAPPPPASSQSAPAAAQGAITLKAGSRALAGRSQKLTGSVPRRYAGRTVVIEQQSGAGWQNLTSAKAASDGRFRAIWRPTRSGRFTLR